MMVKCSRRAGWWPWVVVGGLAAGGCASAQAPAVPAGPVPPAAAVRPTAVAPAPVPAPQPTRVVFQDAFGDEGAPAAERWTISNPDRHRVLVRDGVLGVHAEARAQASRIEFLVGRAAAPLALPSMGCWSVEFDAVVMSLWGEACGEVRVEFRDYAARRESAGSDFVLAERYWQDESGLKFGLFHGGAFVGWHEVAPVGLLGVWHHYRVEYAAGALILWRDGERTLECDMPGLLHQPLLEGVAIELGFHVPPNCGMEGGLDNVAVTVEEADAAPAGPAQP
jgi:hypothetical protein